MKGVKLSIKEIEQLNYYDFMAYLNIPFFSFGGLDSVVQLAELCKIEKGKQILIVGCGTGGNACFLAKKYECSIIGIDISEMMIKKALQRASNEGLNHLIKFKMGDAYNLEFRDNTFDVILTIFVSQFLDINRVFPEFKRILKKGGYIGFNETFRAEDIPKEFLQKGIESEKALADLTGLPFKYHTYSYWKNGLKNIELSDIQLEMLLNTNIKATSKKTIKEIGGYRKFLKMIWSVFYFSIVSKKLRKKIVELGKIKKVSLQSKSTRKYFGYILGVGKKF